MGKSKAPSPRPPVVPLRLDEEAGEFVKGEERLRLGQKPFAMLRLLVERQEKWVSKDDFYNAVWKPRDEDVMDWTFTTYVYEIRKALGDLSKPHQYIETKTNKGYRFIGPVVSSQAAAVSGQGEDNHKASAGFPSSDPSTKFILSDVEGLRTGSGLWTPGVSAPPLSPFAAYVVGREAEIAQLHQWLTTALSGHRQFVFITGEPGIGKTTIARTFLEQVAALGVAAVGRGQCVEHYGPGEAYLPVLEALGRLCRGANGAPLVEWLGQHAPTWLVQMPALLNAGELEALQRRTQGATRERMLREMLEVIEVMTVQRPLVLLLEDLHWGDDSTFTLLSAVARRDELARLMVIGTYRPAETQDALNAVIRELHGHGQCHELALTALSDAAVDEYLGQRFPTGALPTRLPQSLHHVTGGNPLFLVALVDDLIERGVLTQTEEGWTLQGELESVTAEVPENVRQFIGRQIERLNTADQRVLQAASVAGIEFSSAAVAAAIETDIATVENCCTTLAQRQYFLRQAGLSEWPDGTRAARYRFRHALYQYLWNERITPSQLQHLHQRVGERLEDAYRSQPAEIAAELAVHFEQGRDYGRAVRYLQQAAQTALQRSANVEATRLLTRGLDLLKALPETSERLQQELMLQVTIGAPLIATRGFAAPEVENAFARSRDLCQRVGETPHLFPVLRGLAAFYSARAEFKTTYELAEQCQRLASRQQDPLLLLGAHFELGTVLFCLGEFSQARQHWEQGISLYDPKLHRSHSLLYGQDLGVSCLSRMTRVLWFLGYPDQALKRVQEAVTLAREQAHSFSMAYALNFAVDCHRLRGEVQAGQEQADAAIALSLDQGFLIWATAASLLKGWLMAEAGQREEGAAQIRQGLATWQGMGLGISLPHWFGLLADVCGKAGQMEEGLTLVNKALVIASSTGEREYEAELYRLKGEILRQIKGRGQKAKVEAEVEECFQTAIAVARQQSAKSWELRAATSLARLWRQQGKKKEARQMLAEIYGWFTEGFDTRDLQEAKILLEELS